MFKLPSRKNVTRAFAPVVLCATLLGLGSAAFAQAPPPPPDDAAVKRFLAMGQVESAPATTVPIEIWQDLIVVRARVNGVEGRYLWDNGFSTSALDASVRDKVALRAPAGGLPIVATDGNDQQVTMQGGLADRIEVGGIRVAGTPFTHIDMRAMFGQDMGFAGILGASFLRRFNWKFDFDRNEVAISAQPFEVDGQRLPFDTDAYNLSGIELGFNGEMGAAMIDFGDNSDDVSVPMAALPVFGQAPRSHTTGSAAVSVGGRAQDQAMLRIQDFSYRIGGIDGARLHRIKALLTEGERPMRIGNRFFRHYNLAMNYGSSQIVLSPRKTPLAPMPDKGYGATLIAEGGKVLIGLLTKNPNLQANPQLKLGDEIAEIDGRPAASFDPGTLREYQIARLRAGEAMTIKPASGEPVVLRPAGDVYR